VADNERRFLVLVRAGEKSLHRQWLEGAVERDWDLVVSWYGDTEYVPVADERVLLRKGGKWDIIHAHFTEDPGLLGKYTHFWLPDDDIATDAGAINALFAAMEAERLSLAQPGLSADSFFSHLHTLGSPSFRLRYTRLVEVMMPCLTRALLLRVLPLFSLSSSGFGIDHVWARLDADNRGKAAIVDAVTMRHTRPVGKFLAGRLRARGIDPRAEGRRIDARFGLRSAKDFPCYGGVTVSGRRVGQRMTGWLMFVDYCRFASRWVEPTGWRRFWKLLGRLSRPTNLTQLTERPGEAER
jgi:hypothetical protein